MFQEHICAAKCDCLGKYLMKCWLVIVMLWMNTERAEVLMPLGVDLHAAFIHFCTIIQEFRPGWDPGDASAKAIKLGARTSMALQPGY